MSGRALAAAVAIIAAAAAAPAPPARAATLDAVAEPRELHVGDPVRLRLTLTLAAGEELALPQLAGTLGDVEVLSWGAPRTTRGRGGARTIIAEGTVTAWRVGPATIPPLPAFTPGADTSDVRSAPVALSVVSVGVEEGQDLRPIKGPLSLPRDWRPIVAAVLAAVALAALAIVIARRLRRRPVVAPAVPIDPRPAHEIAFAELDLLAADRLVARGLLSDHFVRLTEILRRYFERRFGIDAIDMTTSETLVALRDALGRSADRRAFDALAESRALLEEADLVKFAEYEPEPAGADATVERARALVLATREAPRETETPPAVAAAAS